MSYPGAVGYVSRGPLKKARLNTNKLRTPWVEPTTSGMTSGGYKEGGKGICVDVPPGDTKLAQALASNNITIAAGGGSEGDKIRAGVMDVIRSPAKAAQFWAYTEWYLHQKRALQYFQPDLSSPLVWPQYRYAARYSPTLWQLDPIKQGDKTQERAGQKITLSHIELVISVDALGMTANKMGQARLIIFQWVPTLTAPPAVGSVLAGAASATVGVPPNPVTPNPLPEYWLALSNHETRRQYHVLYDQTWMVYSPLAEVNPGVAGGTPPPPYPYPATVVGGASAQVMMHEKPILANFASAVRMYNQGDATNLQGTGSLWALLLDSNEGKDGAQPTDPKIPDPTTNVRAQVYHRIYFNNE